MTDSTNELEQLKNSWLTLEYEALSEEYWRKQKLFSVLRKIGWIALIIGVSMGIAYIWFGYPILLAVEIIGDACWWLFTIIADEIELSILRQWRLAMIKFVGWNLTADD